MSKVKEVISKELLSFVFTDDQQDFEVVGICPEDKRLLEYIWIQELPDYYTGEGIRRVPMNINIHELAHKCKLWALKDYEIHSATIDNNKASCEIFSTDLQEKEFQAKTEPEAIFKACQWILENKDK